MDPQFLSQVVDLLGAPKLYPCHLFYMFLISRLIFYLLARSPNLSNCRGWFDPSHCAFQELGTGRILGTGTVHNGLYYLDEVMKLHLQHKCLHVKNYYCFIAGLGIPLLLLCLIVILLFLVLVIKNLLYVMLAS